MRSVPTVIPNEREAARQRSPPCFASWDSSAAPQPPSALAKGRNGKTVFPSVVRIEFVPESAQRYDKFTVFLQASAQHFHVRVYGAVVAVKVVPPHLVKQTLPRKRHALVLHKVK